MSPEVRSRIREEFQNHLRGLDGIFQEKIKAAFHGRVRSVADSWAKAIVEHLSNELKSASSDKEVVEGSINHGINASEALQYLNDLTRSKENGFVYIPRVDNSIPGHTLSSIFKQPSFMAVSGIPIQIASNRMIDGSFPYEGELLF